MINGGQFTVPAALGNKVDPPVQRFPAPRRRHWRRRRPERRSGDAQPAAHRAAVGPAHARTLHARRAEHERRIGDSPSRRTGDVGPAVVRGLEQHEQGAVIGISSTPSDPERHDARSGRRTAGRFGGGSAVPLTDILTGWHVRACTESLGENTVVDGAQRHHRRHRAPVRGSSLFGVDRRPRLGRRPRRAERPDSRISDR